MSEKKKKNKVVVLIVLLLAILCSIIFFRNSDILNGNLSKDAVIGMLPGTTKEELLAEMQKEVDESLFNFNINSKVTLKDKSMNIELQNQPSNYYNMKMEVKLVEDDSVIYKSGLLEPNQYIADAKVKKDISLGEHKAIATLTAYNPKTNQVEGVVEVEILINSI